MEKYQSSVRVDSISEVLEYITLTINFNKKKKKAQRETYTKCNNIRSERILQRVCGEIAKY